MGLPARQVPDDFDKLQGLPALKSEKYTRNEWRRCKTTLETSGKDVNYTRNEWKRSKTTLVSSGEDVGP